MLAVSSPCCFHSRNSGVENAFGDPFAMVFQTTMIRLGFVNGSERSSTELITLNIAVFAPMPSASVMTATAVNPGDFASMREPKRTSCNRVSIIRTSVQPWDRRSPRGGRRSHGCTEVRMMETLLQDVRFGSRMLAKSPGFTAVAVITLALGIGANTAMFSVINSVLLRSLPFTNPSRIMVVWKTMANGSPNAFSTPEFLEWKQQGELTANMGAFSSVGKNIGGKDLPERITG